jgi:hypothetical protein
MRAAVEHEPDVGVVGQQRRLDAPESLQLLLLPCFNVGFIIVDDL